MSRFRFIDGAKAHDPIALLGRTLQVSRAGDDAWQQRQPSARALADAQLTDPIVAVPHPSRGTDGAPRVHAQLKAVGQPG